MSASPDQFFQKQGMSVFPKTDIRPVNEAGVEGPQPLVREIPPGAAYPVESLGPLRDAVEAVQDMTQAPVAIAAQSALAVASLAVQAFANVETLGDDAPASLFCLTIAQSGERKSACDRKLMAGFRKYERERAEEYREVYAEWKTRHKLWTAKSDRLTREAASGNPDKVGAAEADLEALGAEPQAPLSPNLTATEPTLEGLVKLYIVGQPSLGLFTDEAGGFLGGHAMNSDNRLKTLSGLSNLWDGEPLNRTRAGDGAKTLYGRRLAVHLMVQPIAARPLMADPVAIGQGFLARFLITEPQSAIGKRLRRGYSPSSKVAEVAMAKRVEAILSHPKPTAENTPQELEPRRLPLSDDARELLWQYYKTVELGQTAGGDLEHVRPFASKAPEQAARIAAVLTLWADLQAPEVTAATMADAVELSQFYLGEVKRLTDAAVVSEDIRKADGLRLWLLNSWPERARLLDRDPATILPRDVVQFGPGALRETKTAKQFMALLAEHGWLVGLPEGAEVDGAPRQLAYRIRRI